MNTSDTMETQMNVNDLKKSLQQFNWIDWSVFMFMVLSCAAIGIYFGYFDKRRRKRLQSLPDASYVAEDYLMGGRQMSIIPIALSLAASWIAGPGILGVVTETFIFGTPYFFFICIFTLAGIISSYIYLPVFYELRLNSCYEYLEIRFDRRMRLYGSILFGFAGVFMLPAIMYIPALVFNQVSGANMAIVTPLVCVICIFYTIVGGIKAVVWTDCLQTVIMIGAMLFIVIKGTENTHGLVNIWTKSWTGDRITLPEFTLDLNVRHSYLSMILGLTTLLIYTMVMSQSMLQRYLSLPTLRDAKYALSFYVFTVLSMWTICYYAGLLAYTLYSNCNPLQTKLIHAPDQILPLLVMDTTSKTYSGISGLFVAGIFSASLSSLSTVLNSMAAVVLEDFYRPFAKKSLTAKQTTYLMKGVVLVVGTIITTLAFFMDRLGIMLQFQFSIVGVIAGPVFGVFTMGVLMPWVKKKGAFYGGVFGLIVVFWVFLKAQIDIAKGQLTFPKKPLYTDECTYSFESSSSLNQSHYISKEDRIHHISYLFYTPMGAVVSIVVGTIVSAFFDVHQELDPKVFSHLIRKFMTPSQNVLNKTQMNDDEKDCVIHTFESQDNKVQ